MTVKERVNPKAGCMGIVISLGVLLFCSAMITILLTVAIWPGEAKLTAPFLCSEDQSDAFVVVDSYSTEPGETSYNFTLYCVGDRGDFTDAGFGAPFFILWGLHTVLLLGLIALFVVYRSIRRRGRADDLGSGTSPAVVATGVGLDPADLVIPDPNIPEPTLSNPVIPGSTISDPVPAPEPQAPPGEPEPPLPPGPIT